MISKENKEIPIASKNFPEKSSGVKPTQKQLKKALDDATRDFREIDLPELEKKYPPVDGDTLRITFHGPGECGD